MDNKSLELLEFQRVREILAEFTSFSASRELALKLEPSSESDRVSLLLKQSAEARSLLSREPEFSIGGVNDIREDIEVAVLGRILEPVKLIEIQDTLSAISRLRSRLNKLSADLPLFWHIAEGLIEQRDLVKAIGSSIAPSGEVLDSVSVKLSNIRQKLKQAREELLKRLDGLMKGPKGRNIIQEPIITEREGRYVIPIKIENRKEIKGIIHDISNTGATVFIEPWATVDLGNELRELVQEEKREIERILMELSEKVVAHESEICHNIELVADLDLALAKAKYAQRYNATEPIITSFDKEMNDNGSEHFGLLRLVSARHPLLAEKAVPLSLEIGKDFSVLVITGPNTGGKTVALKTIGLLSLMVQAGMPIPAAAESCIPVFTNIFADIGDEQSIDQTLSSFSWHIGNIVRIIKDTDRRNLVLLDELGTSTDPEEGSALARSILLHFLWSGTLTVATTHYGALKAFAHATQGMQNASFEFDPTTLSPNYRLTLGIPGGSNALATASRLGVPADVIARAKDMISSGSQQLDELLADLNREKMLVENLRRDTNKAKVEFELQQKELQEELKKMRSDGQRFARESRDNILLEAAKLQKEIRKAESELAMKKSRESIMRAQNVVAKTKQEIRGDVWKAKIAEEKEQEIIDNQITVGDIIYIRDADVEATVLSVSHEKEKVEVQVGDARLTLSLDSISKVNSTIDRDATRFIPVRRILSKKVVKEELDLRGRRAEEVESLLDRYLNQASLSSLGKVYIIHGVGTGTVRDIVRETLKSHLLVKSFRAGKQEEGGDGVTAVEL